MSLDCKLQKSKVFDLLINAKTLKDVHISSDALLFDLINSLDPLFQMKLVGDGYDQTVSSSLAGSLIDLQKIIHKIYTIAVYGTSNTRKLTADDREVLEIFFRVESGCSEVKADLKDVVKAIMGGAIKKMSRTQVFIIALSIIIGFTGYQAYKLFLEDRDKERANSLNSRQQEFNFELLQHEQKTQSNLVEIIKNLSSKDPRTEEIYLLNAESVPEVILKISETTDYTEFNGFPLTGEKARFLNKKDNDSYHLFKDKWDVIILGVNTSLDDDEGSEPSVEWKLNIYSVLHGRKFNISLPSPNLLDNDKKTAIWSSLDKGTSLTIFISGKKSNSDNQAVKDIILTDVE